MALEGKDVIGQAQLVGKTAAAGLPEKSVQKKRLSSFGRRSTRELAVQVEELFALVVRVKSRSVYGGSSIEKQIKALKIPGAHIVVRTPGRLLDLLNARP